MKKIFILLFITVNLIVLNSCDKPGELPDGSKPDTGSSGTDGPQSHSEQCQAITQSGTQCKRKATAGSTFCWQHQP